MTRLKRILLAAAALVTGSAMALGLALSTANQADVQPLTGRDQPVVAFLEREPAVERMYGDIHRFVESWLPDYARDNRNYLTVAIGCTGGRHRSVYLVERLAKAFAPHQQVLIRHRELG